MPADRLPPALDNEGAFAASGTNVAVFGSTHAWFGTGAAARSRVLHTADRGTTWTIAETPLRAGQTSGIYSVAFRDALNGVVVGGDYSKETEAINNAAITRDGGRTWMAVNGLTGFRSVVAYIPGQKAGILAVGPQGTDMNLPIARGLRGLIYVLWDLSQVDPSDLSILFAGQGRLRIGFSELDPPSGHEPTDEQIHEAVRGCWANPFCAFDGAVGTSLVCIQGNWSNVVDGKIKGQIAALALRQCADSPYNPLYARAVRAPRPWGVTTLFAEHTGNHPPLEIDWSAEKRVPMRFNGASDTESPVDAEPEEEVALTTSHADPVLADVGPTVAEVPIVAGDISPAFEPANQPEAATSFSSFWDFARAVNRSDPAALALAGNGADMASRIASVPKVLKSDAKNRLLVTDADAATRSSMVMKSCAA